MVEQVLAAVRTGPSQTEIREFPMPEIAADSALLRMEVAGICGTDVKLYGHPPSEAPVMSFIRRQRTNSRIASEAAIVTIAR